MKKRICILGSGNVAWHLHRGFTSAGHEVIQVYTPKSLDKASELAYHVIHQLELLDTTADLWIMALKDDVLEEIAGKLPVGPILAHTSGRAPLQVLNQYKGKTAVFYPLQSLTRGINTPFSSIPLLIESDDEMVSQDLINLAESMGCPTQRVSSAQRAELHVAAVFVNNFVNYLYDVGFDLLQSKNLPFDLLKPLISETARKIHGLKPFDAQTGPAKRGDRKTIQAHLDLLAEYPSYQDLYLNLSKRISDKHETEL